MICQYRFSMKRKRLEKIIFAGLVALFFFSYVHTAISDTVPFNSDRWVINSKESKIIQYLGRTTLYLSSGVALVKDSDLTDGIIEFDIACTGERGYMGVVWRALDDHNFENFYIRPHQSGNPDANQYQPVFNDNDAWQLYYGEDYSAPIKYDFNQWMHMKIIVSGANAEIYIKDMEHPALLVNLKRETKSGKVGLQVGDAAPGYFSNFTYTAIDHPPLKGQPKSPPAPAIGTVMRWQVSNPIDGKSLENKFRLTAKDKQTLTWQTLGSENTGITNLGKLQRLAEGADTVFARVIIVADQEQIKRIQFGFSDQVKAYFNDQLIYGGNDRYRSRDYRFLGTIGLYDELYLPLNKGENELWLAITENFGGWGVLAKFDDLTGIAVKP